MDYAIHDSTNVVTNVMDHDKRSFVKIQSNHIHMGVEFVAIPVIIYYPHVTIIK